MKVVKMADPKTPTKLQKALDFKQKYEALITEAKDEALAQIKEAVESLKDLGLTYHVLSDEEYQRLYQPVALPTAKRGRPPGSTNTPKKADSPSAKFNPASTCTICGIGGHHTRAHNFQKPSAKFTPEELAARGYAPPQ